MYELEVENMSCAHCVGAVTKAVQELDPNARVDIDLGAKRVTVESGIELARISAAIAAAGYPVSGAS